MARIDKLIDACIVTPKGVVVRQGKNKGLYFKDEKFHLYHNFIKVGEYENTIEGVTNYNNI